MLMILVALMAVSLLAISHKKFGGIELSLGAGGLRFKKRPSGFNICIGNKMKGTKGGGRYDKSFQDKFTNAVHACGGRKGK